MKPALLEPSRTFLAHNAPVNQVVASPEAGYYATADINLQVKVWRGEETASTLDVRSIFDKVKPTERVRGLAFSKDMRQIIIAAGELVNGYQIGDPCELLWSHTAPRLFAFLVVSPSDLAVEPGGVIAVPFDNGSMAFYEPDGHIFNNIKHNAVPRFLHGLRDGRFIGADAFSVTLWEAGSKNPLKSMTVSERIYGFSSSPSGDVVAVRHLFETKVMAFNSGAVLASHRVARGLPLVRISPDSKAVAIGTKHEIAIYGLGSGGGEARFEISDAELISMNFDAYGQQIMAGCSDGMVRIWQYNPAA